MVLSPLLQPLQLPLPPLVPLVKPPVLLSRPNSM